MDGRVMMRGKIKKKSDLLFWYLDMKFLLYFAT